MSEAQGTVIGLEGEYALVRMDDSGCGRCHETGGCGGQRLEKMFCHTPVAYRLSNPGSAQVGERVTVVIADGAIGRSAAQAYGFPLFALFVGAFGGLGLAGEIGAIAGAALGLFLGWLALRCRAHGRDADMTIRPHIKR